MRLNTNIYDRHEIHVETYLKYLVHSGKEATLCRLFIFAVRYSIVKPSNTTSILTPIIRVLATKISNNIQLKYEYYSIFGQENEYFYYITDSTHVPYLISIRDNFLVILKDRILLLWN